MASKKRARGPRPAEVFEVLPVDQARARDSDAKRAARRVAEALGEVVGDSASVDGARREVAFAFDVHPHAGDPGLSLIVAGAAALDAQVVLRVARDRAFSGLLLGKAIASSAPERLVAGAHLAVEVDGAVSTVRLTLAEDLAAGLGAARIFIANVEAAAPSAPAPGGRTKLERCLARLQRLRELDGPKMVIDDEKELIRRVHAELLAAGWDPESDPLPEPLRALCASVVRARRRR